MTMMKPRSSVHHDARASAGVSAAGQAATSSQGPVECRLTPCHRYALGRFRFELSGPKCATAPSDVELQIAGDPIPRPAISRS